VALLAAALQSYGIGSWPMADDEVPSLVELGLRDIDPATFSVPPDQVGRLPRTLPVWYGSQRFLLDRLPQSDVSYRIPSLVYGVLTSVAVFLLAARWRGLWFALAVSLVLNLSQPYVYIAQLNRFYAMPLLLLVLGLAAIWLPGRNLVLTLATAILAVLAVLSHNMTMAVFVLAFMAAVPAFVVGHVPLRVVWRSGVAAVIGLALYLFYIRPIVAGWHSTGNPTPVLVSFAAHAGIPTLALAGLGAWLAVVRRHDAPAMLWWTLLFVGSLCVFQLTDIGWNPRYFVFFMPAMWMLAGHAVDVIARALVSRWVALAWYACVALLLAPGLLSHYQDGSRHDYRAAADVLQAQARDGQPILSDDAETISYYLPEDFRQRLLVRTKVREFPSSEFFLVARSNAWMPLPRVPGRRMDAVAEIARRRYDQFSHILRVYRVAPAPPMTP
jgi:hypothetical protein